MIGAFAPKAPNYRVSFMLFPSWYFITCIFQGKHFEIGKADMHIFQPLRVLEI